MEELWTLPASLHRLVLATQEARNVTGHITTPGRRSRRAPAGPHAPRSRGRASAARAQSGPAGRSPCRRRRPRRGARARARRRARPPPRARRRDGRRARARGTRAAPPRSALDAGDLDQLRHCLGGLRTLAEPVLDLRLVELDRRRVGLRVVTAHDLEEAAVARRPRIGGDDAVDRVLLRAHAGESELDSHSCPLLPPGLLLLALHARLPPCGETRLLQRLLRGLAREGRHLPPPQLLHHLLHLLARLEQLVHLLHRRARALRDAKAALTVDHDRRTALLRRHRQHDRLDAAQLVLVDVDVAELVLHPGDHLQDPLQRAHPPQHLVRLQEVVERELAGGETLFHLRLLVLFDRRFRALDEREHVAHAEDARRHPVRVEHLERIHLLADRRELDRFSGHGLHAQRRAASSIAVQLREDDAVEGDALVERLRDVHRFLACHRIEDEQDVVRAGDVADALQLLHQLLVDLQAAGGVDDDRVEAFRPRALEAAARRLYRILRIGAEHRDVDLLAELLELVDRGRAL